MKRKTNLFYTSGPDSKFLTFSNYTECLTGNFLSLETKLFPDKFLCLKINGLTEANKSDFIKYLVAYYENKLAILRDYNINNNANVEINMHPLSYLLEAILKVCDYNDGVWNLNLSKKDRPLNIEDIEDIENRESIITYIGEITEQDYNGIYTDTICTIDLNTYYEGQIVCKDAADINGEIQLQASQNINYLYGWDNEDELIIPEYENVTPIYDDSNDEYGYAYKFNALLSRINLKEIKREDTKESNKVLQFNVIIPLFNLINRNIENWTPFYTDDDKIIKYINLNHENGHVYDVPYGIWIYTSGDQYNKFIELRKDKDLDMYPSWSLLISSQFKPFPYSNKLVEDNYTRNSIMHAHATYSEILSKFNNFMDMFTTLNSELHELNNRIQTVENSIKEMGTVANISDTNKKLINTEIRITNMIDDLKEKIYGYIDNITWTDHITK